MLSIKLRMLHCAFTRLQIIVHFNACGMQLKHKTNKQAHAPTHKSTRNTEHTTHNTQHTTHNTQHIFCFCSGLSGRSPLQVSRRRATGLRTDGQRSGPEDRQTNAARQKQDAKQGSSRTRRRGGEREAGGTANAGRQRQTRGHNSEEHTTAREAGQKAEDRTRTGWTNGTDNGRSHNKQQQKRNKATAENPHAA